MKLILVGIGCFIFGLFSGCAVTIFATASGKASMCENCVYNESVDVENE